MLCMNFSYLSEEVIPTTIEDLHTPAAKHH